MLNHLLRDRIVCGSRTSDVQKALLCHPKLTLQAAENIVLAAEAARQEQYPLPVINDLFAALPEGDVYSTLDLRDAYNQVPLDEQSKKLTVINTHREVQAYLDDILVAEKGNDGGTNLKAVLQRFREYGVKLRKDKCNFRMPEVSYLGHKICTGGLPPLEKNMDAIMKAPTSKNLGAYQCKIEYKHGSGNLNADALSRLPLETTEDT
nr:uncharacterized protein K02A2.6-like [Dermacentor andersoni]